MNEFILFKKVSKLQLAIITRYCKVYFGILYLYNIMLYLVPIFYTCENVLKKIIRKNKYMSFNVAIKFVASNNEDGLLFVFIW